MRLSSIILSSITAFGLISTSDTRALCDGPNADVSALFAHVAAAYRNFKSVSFDLEAVAISPTSHHSDTIKTRLSLSKPNLMSAELTGKQGIIRVVADGKAIFVSSSKDSSKYLKKADTGYISIVQALSNAGGCGVGLTSVLLTDPAAETKIAQGSTVFVRRAPDMVCSGDKCDVVNAETNNGNQLVSYTFAFAKSDHFLRRVTVSDPKHSGTPLFTESYTSVKINPSVSPGLFRFAAPKGAVAIDPNVQPLPYDARVKVGANPIPITGSDLAGKPVSLSQYKGKVLLLDFWATWCGPCIHELPNVVAAYGKYHAQGFDVVGITLDKENAKQRVQEFVTTNNIPWRQVYDGKYWMAANAAAYGVRSIPFTVLIGRDGKIAAVEARGSQLGPAITAALSRK